MSLRAAINAKCRSCVYDPANGGTWRQQVTLCAVTDCPLYPVRPTTNATIPESILAMYGLTPEGWAKECRESAVKRSNWPDLSEKKPEPDSVTNE